MAAVIAQIGLRPEKIVSGRQLRQIDDVVVSRLQKSDYEVLNRKISFHSGMMACSMSYSEFLEEYKELRFDDFSYELTGKDFSILISKKPLCHVALCLEVDGSNGKQFDVACLLTSIDHQVLKWKRTDLLSERDYRELSEKKNRKLTFSAAVFGAAIGAAIGASITYLITHLSTQLMK